MRHLMKDLFQKWEIVHSTQDISDYYKAKARLSDNNIVFKISTMTSNTEKNRKNGSITTYHIKVKEEDVRRSNDAIHQ
ncbi:hypothetical protein SAMN04488072_104180 [Lentibacillus halodurans]|uniref:Uncharacterized protein n=1 Tax=Lentibacillus halodurans TaxID=237679 RepID=A0A1I0X8E9_9BACI|nr:hypothetical protein [Lentibacillus halodurans]SFA96273.1 hypothetical protein SAMN04488072_104180 [Lentibacillus halodurans]